MTKKKTAPSTNGKGPRPIDQEAMEAIPRKARGRVEMALMGGGSKGITHLTKEALGTDERNAYNYMARLLREMTADGLLVKLRHPTDHKQVLYRWAHFEEETPTPERPEIPEWLLLPDKPSKLSDPSQPPGAQFHNSCNWIRERDGHYYKQSAGQGFDIKSLVKADWVCWLTDIKFYLRGYIPEPPRQTRNFGPQSVSQVLLMLYETGPTDLPGQVKNACADIVRVENAGAPNYAFLPETVLWHNGIAIWRPGHAFRFRTGANAIGGILRGGKYLPPPEVVAQLQREITAQYHGAQGVQKAPQTFDWRDRT